MMEKAIKIAIENEYKFGFVIGFYRPVWAMESVDGRPLDFPITCVFLDPVFWQALGKGLGWKSLVEEGQTVWWRKNMHDFVDHLADGKGVESFFENLLK